MCLLLVVFAAGVACLYAARGVQHGWVRLRAACRRRLFEAVVRIETAHGLAEIEKFLRSQPGGSACGDPPDAGRDGTAS